MRTKISLFAAVSVLCTATPAIAGPGDPIAITDEITFDLSAAARVRYEMVDQDNAVSDADAVTARLRLGGEIKSGGISFLVEGEGTLALVDDYNDTLPGNGVEPFSVVADPESLELNRLQFSYMDNGSGFTVGRQRIILDNARFVGNVGWRQNEQTFDAVRGQLSVGPFSFDGTYSISQRTIFGSDSPNEHFDGNFFFLNAGADVTSNVKVKAFAYLIDYDTRLAFSSDTIGAMASATIPLGGPSLSLSATYATQGDAGGNPTAYDADYIALSAGGSIAGFTLTAGYEELGSDGGVASFQTPMATIHAFQGWADLFLVTPANGVRDYYGSIRKQFTIPGVSTFTATVVYHEFDADFGGLNYGSEWDASLGFRAGPVGLLAKFADYNAKGFGIDTTKFWLQAEYSF